MLRIHFTAEDLARTRVAATIGAAAETYYSLEMLCRRSLPLPFQRWRATVINRLGEEARPLVTLLPARGPGLDLLALAGDSPDIDHAVDVLLRAPRTQIRRELQPVTVDPVHLPWARAVADGGTDARRLLAAGLLACHQATVAPYWAASRSRLDAVRAQYAHTFLEGGVDALLASLSPALMRWRPPVLEVRYPRPVEVHLGGRGLILVPTLFSWRQSSLLHDPYDDASVPRLTVPAVTDPTTGAALSPPEGPVADDALAALLGRTRAAALRAAAEGCSTTELAARLGVSLPAVSQHTKALRDAHLITTSRRGGSVLHMTTALGRELLDGNR
ncbi:MULTISPECIES: ArsR/SmtB family transcription factor [Streptomyces]|uniref:ArsR family transcriptional regulator n=2 Tax=Streptomyces TaxID=1883 RepID=A0A100Y5V7_9ACTN|nr:MULTISPECIES: winged helix-turn-helix transcriptional regulator [Streptomyces]KUH38275.1 ArsR family transcriptional regulator [Streptomyces kanasensis]UUS29382.1 helix-turn-helix domain-containing protein [Streptomyces changanensis]